MPTPEPLAGPTGAQGDDPTQEGVLLREQSALGRQDQEELLPQWYGEGGTWWAIGAVAAVG